MSQPFPWWKRLLSRPAAFGSTSAQNGFDAPGLINEIRKVRLPFGYGMWSIGRTDNLFARRQELAHPSHWQAWPTESSSVARYVVQHFAVRGMQLDSQTDDGGRFVYVHLVEEWRRSTAA